MNKAKLKAKELINKYLRLEDDTTFYWNYNDRRMLDEEVLDHAIKCAVVNVEELLDQYWSHDPKKQFWISVKNELLNYER